MTCKHGRPEDMCAACAHEKLTPASASRTIEGVPVDPKPIQPTRVVDRETVQHDLRIALIMSAIQAELERATRKHGPMRTAHEAFGVIYEEFNIEFAAAMHQNDMDQMRKEAIQCAAMFARFLYDLGGNNG